MRIALTTTMRMSGTRMGRCMIDFNAPGVVSDSREASVVRAQRSCSRRGSSTLSICAISASTVFERSRRLSASVRVSSTLSDAHGETSRRTQLAPTGIDAFVPDGSAPTQLRGTLQGFLQRRQ